VAYFSRLLIPTLKEAPAEAEVPSHALMLRAGFIRRTASGLYAYLPLGLRMLAKVMAIIRQELNAAGGQEVLLPLIQPMELWQKTGRDVDYGDMLTTVTDRQGRRSVLSPTAEEAITALMAGEIRSYKQFPLILYQLNTKFRDELRPRFGVLRTREFLMQDAYSFDADAAAMQRSYAAMRQAYQRIFRRCGLPYVIVQADAGEMGGAGSEQFVVPCATGEDVIVRTDDGAYVAALEAAAADAPAPPSGQRTGPAMEEVFTPGVGSIEAVCAFLKARPAEMIKTLIFRRGEGLVVALVRGDHELNVSKLARSVGGRVELADEAAVRGLTGAAVGFAGPMGMAGRVAALRIDPAVAAMAEGIAGANRTDHHTRHVVAGRDFPLAGDNIAIADIRTAVEGDTWHGRPLRFERGIEVGHLFQLGDKYSKPLGASFLDDAGTQHDCLMGSYGIGVNRILAAAIEVGHNDAGCILPAALAPFDVEIIAINIDAEPVRQAAEALSRQLAAAGIEVLLDDRPARAGVKFKDADLVGIPLRLVLGEKNLAEGRVELRRRTDKEASTVELARVVGEILKLLADCRHESADSGWHSRMV
jgi:prolyl-tRNA synthetase